MGTKATQTARFAEMFDKFFDCLNGQVDLQECCPEIHLGLHTDHEMTGSSDKRVHQ